MAWRPTPLELAKENLKDAQRRLRTAQEDVTKYLKEIETLESSPLKPALPQERREVEILVLD